MPQMKSLTFIGAGSSPISYEVVDEPARQEISGLTAAVGAIQQNKADRSDIPTKVSQLQNDSEYITMADIFPVGSVCITTSNVSPDATYGGTWSLIHKRLKAAIVETFVAYDETNIDTATATSVAVIDGNSIQIRLQFKTAVSLGDSDVRLGQFNFAKLGISQKYSEIVPAIFDGGNGIADVRINNTGLMESVDVIIKGTGTTLAAGNTGQLRANLMIKPEWTLDSACDEFHWVRTA